MRLVFASYFQSLENYCDARNEPVTRPGLVRFIAGDHASDDDLKRFDLVKVLRFGNQRAALHLRKDDVDFIATMGFEFGADLVDLVEEDMSSGLFVLIAVETRAQPIKPPSWVRNFVEASSLTDDSSYDGHDYALVRELMPTMRLFRCSEELDAETAAHHILTLCIGECERGGSWINSSLAAELRAMCDSGIQHMPYEAIARSTFDSDPRTMYMALYRCLEATYAYEACRKLARALGLPVAWRELAIALDSELNWRPQEASSLNLVLRYADRQDLEASLSPVGWWTFRS